MCLISFNLYKIGKKNLISCLVFAKVLTIRERWLVHRGESSETNDLLFTVQRSHALQMKTRLDVFLASSTNGDISNFQVVGCYSSQSCKVYKGDTLVAEVTSISPHLGFMKSMIKIKGTFFFYSYIFSRNEC